MKRMREKYNLTDDMLTWFCEDGEQVQIDCIKEDECTELLRSNFIEVGKTNASRTECEQACDAGDQFKNTNTE